jgi:hypothetical protein
MNAINWVGGGVTANYPNTQVVATVNGGSGPQSVSFYFDVYIGYTAHHVATALKDAWNQAASPDYAATVIFRQVRLPTTCSFQSLTIGGTLIPTNGNQTSVLSLDVWTQQAEF